jgi:hypothetical protein
VLFIVTFITSIAAVILYNPILDDADYILGAAPTRPWSWGPPWSCS